MPSTLGELPNSQSTMVVFSFRIGSAYPSIDNFFHIHGQCTKIVHAFCGPAPSACRWPVERTNALTCGPCQGRDNAKDGATGTGVGVVEKDAAATVAGAAAAADDVWSMVNLAAVYFDCCASGARITM